MKTEHGAALDMDPQFDRAELERRVDLFFAEAAFYLGMAHRTLYNTWRARGLVAYKDHMGRSFFKRADLDHYMKECRKRKA